MKFIRFILRKKDKRKKLCYLIEVLLPTFIWETYFSRNEIVSFSYTGNMYNMLYTLYSINLYILS